MPASPPRPAASGARQALTPCCAVQGRVRDSTLAPVSEATTASVAAAQRRLHAGPDAARRLSQDSTGAASVSSTARLPAAFAPGSADAAREGRSVAAQLRRNSAEQRRDASAAAAHRRKASAEQSRSVSPHQTGHCHGVLRLHGPPCRTCACVRRPCEDVGQGPELHLQTHIGASPQRLADVQPRHPAGAVTDLAACIEQAAAGPALPHDRRRVR